MRHRFLHTAAAFYYPKKGKLKLTFRLRLKQLELEASCPDIRTEINQNITKAQNLYSIWLSKWFNWLVQFFFFFCLCLLHFIFGMPTMDDVFALDWPQINEQFGGKGLYHTHTHTHKKKGGGGGADSSWWDKRWDGHIHLSPCAFVIHERPSTPNNVQQKRKQQQQQLQLQQEKENSSFSRPRPQPDCPMGYWRFRLPNANGNVTKKKKKKKNGQKKI